MSVNQRRRRRRKSLPGEGTACAKGNTWAGAARARSSMGQAEDQTPWGLQTMLRNMDFYLKGIQKPSESW